MSQSVELEFKTMLTPQQFEQILVHFNLKDHEPLIQTNTYYDTDHQDMLAHNAALRLRNFPETSEWTIKQKVDKLTSIELTQSQPTVMTPPQTLNRDIFNHNEIISFVEDIDLNWSDLHQTYQMTTHRWTLPYRGGELCIDQTDFGSVVDYELEFEVNHIDSECDWLELLTQFDIHYAIADKKIARAAKYRQQN